jgi:cysteine desulfurase/selenocysteine lyase
VNAPGIAGLDAGIGVVLASGVESLHRRSAALKHRLRSGLQSIRGVTVRSPADPDGVGIVTITTSGMDASTLAHRLDREWDVQARAGLHCAPETHALLGTVGGGALRFSLGWASSEEDVDAALEGVDALAGGRAR